MNLKTIYNKITGDIRAVSPVVATLVLIVVAIVGAAAVGVMTGTFADQVGDQRTDPATAGRTLIVSGSSSVYPVARELAKEFMLANPGIRVITQNVGTGTGIRAAGLDTVDIGMASRNLTVNETRDFPALVGRVVTIGNSTVVLIANANITMANLTNVTHTDLRTLFNDGIVTPRLLELGITHGVFRADSSGTGDVFLSDIVRGAAGTPGRAGAVTHASVHAAAATPHGARNLTLALYNAGVFAAVRDTPGAIGGIDVGFATADVRVSTNTTSPSMHRAGRPFNMMTNGAPSALEQAFIDYARSPVAAPIFTRLGVTSIATPR